MVNLKSQRKGEKEFIPKMLPKVKTNTKRKAEVKGKEDK
jgi:hypothetical protein